MEPAGRFAFRAVRLCAQRGTQQKKAPQSASSIYSPSFAANFKRIADRIPTDPARRDELTSVTADNCVRPQSSDRLTVGLLILVESGITCSISPTRRNFRFHSGNLRDTHSPMHRRIPQRQIKLPRETSRKLILVENNSTEINFRHFLIFSFFKTGRMICDVMVPTLTSMSPIIVLTYSIACF